MSAADNNNMNLTSIVQNLVSIEDNINFISDDDGNIILNIPVIPNTSQSSQLDELLKTFDLSEVKPYLTSKYMNYVHIFYIFLLISLTKN